MTVNRVPLLDLRRDTEAMDRELEAAFVRVLRSGHYILGPEVEAFEREVATYIGVDHALAVSSGTDALLLALMALGIGPGDEVICPTYTFFATAGTIARVGARPVFADVMPCCYNILPAELERLVTDRTKAIVPVHLFGQCAHMDLITSFADARKIPVIEDAAQALGAKYNGRSAGTLGSFGSYSFFPSKNLGALGDAGLLVTNDSRLAERARILRVHGGKPKYHHQFVGGNFRMDALQAALLRVKLPHLDSATARRQANAATYTRLLGGTEQIELPARCHESHIYNQFVIRVKGEGNRDKLQRFLAEAGVGTEVYYPVPMHKQACFASYEPAPSLPVAEAASRETLAIPIFPELAEHEIEYVCDRIRAFAHAL